jgi:hypothetical protein
MMTDNVLQSFILCSNQDNTQTLLTTFFNQLLIPKFNKPIKSANNFSHPDTTKQISTIDDTRYHPPSSNIQGTCWQEQLEKYHPKLAKVYSSAGILIPLTWMIVTYIW